MIKTFWNWLVGVEKRTVAHVVAEFNSIYDDVIAELKELEAKARDEATAVEAEIAALTEKHGAAIAEAAVAQRVASTVAAAKIVP